MFSITASKRVGLALFLTAILEVTALDALAQRPGGDAPRTGRVSGGGGEIYIRPRARVEQDPSESDNSWIGWVVGGVLVVLLIGGAVAGFVAVQNQQRKKKAEAEVVDEAGVIKGYRLKTHLMTGQTSQVWEVVEIKSNRHFAMKVLLPEKAKDPDARHMLFHEAEVGMIMSHPNIIKIVSVTKDMKNPNFVMEFFPSGSLKLKIMHKQTDFFRENAQSILRQSATALAFMNAKGWVHRDVKPDNMLVNAAGELKLIDFAIAQKIPTGWARKFYRKQKAQGTRSYMSPEQIRGQALDGRSDIYSYGIAAYEMLTGRPPFVGASAQELLSKHITEKPVSPQVYNRDLTDEISALILHCIAKKPEQRPKDFHEILMKLKAIKVFKTPPRSPTAPAAAAPK